MLNEYFAPQSQFAHIFTGIHEENLFDSDYIKNLDIDEFLELREDSEDFEANWMRVYNELQKSELDETVKLEIDKIREGVFRLIYQFSGDGELAGEVSDDFEIMCKAYSLSFEDSWLAIMANTYSKKIIPYGILQGSCSTFRDEFLKLH